MELSDRFLNAIHELDAVADGAPADEARTTFDAATLQTFWRDWPRISSWAGALWRLLNEEVAHAVTPEGAEGAPETGGSE